MKGQKIREYSTTTYPGITAIRDSTGVFKTGTPPASGKKHNEEINYRTQFIYTLWNKYGEVVKSGSCGALANYLKCHPGTITDVCVKNRLYAKHYTITREAYNHDKALREGVVGADVSTLQFSLFH